jgi:hypothetical protein
MAEFNEWGDGLEEALAAPFPPEAHKTLRKGGTDITFVSVWDYVNRLNELVGPGGWEDRVTLHDAGGRLIATVELTILGITKTNVGDEEEAKDGFGTAATNAWAQALKRSASLFGLGLYLYDKDGRAAATKPQPEKRKRDAPKGRSSSDDAVLPSGEYAGKKLSDGKIPAAYLMTRYDELKRRKSQESLRWQKLIEAELERRGSKGD